MSTDRRFRLLGQGLPGKTDFKTPSLSDNDVISWDSASGLWTAGAPAAAAASAWGTITGTLADQTDLQTVLDLKLEIADLSGYTQDSVEESITATWAFDAGLSINRPADHWTEGDTAEDVYWGLTRDGVDYGAITTNGSYGFDLISNGYRDDGGGWTSYSLNSNAGASQISLRPYGDILFLGQSDAPSGTQPTVAYQFDASVGSHQWYSLGDNMFYLGPNEARLTGTSADTPFFSFYNDSDVRLAFIQTTSGSFTMMGEDHGNTIALIAENLSGTDKNLIIADPDGTTDIYAEGNRKFRATTNGLLMDDGALGLGYDEITLNASGLAVQTRSMHTIDTYANAATDNCDTITATGNVAGTILILKPASASRDVTFRDGVGNLQLAGNFTFTSSHDILMLVNWGANWYEISRSNNA